jgi:hypothetical protein
LAFSHEKQAARYLISAIEDGKLSTAQASRAFEDADPALVHFVFAWLRAWYPPSHPAADAVLGRLGQLVSQHPAAARLAKEGQQDAIVAWFEDAYSYRDLRADEFVDLIVEKLEG